MEMTNYTRGLIDRAAAQIVRQFARTPVGELKISGAAHATPWVSVDVRLGPNGGIRYIGAALGIKGGYRLFEASHLIEAIAKDQPAQAHHIVKEIIEQAVEWEIAGGWKKAG